PAGAKIVTIYVEAVDADGLSVKNSITIDREAPYLGKIALLDSDGLVNAPNVKLVLSATNATKMRFAEDAEGLAGATAVPYATTHTHALSDTDDGAKTIYVEYLDDAGNATGARGEIAVSFVLDTTAPLASKIELLAPASPT